MQHDDDADAPRPPDGDWLGTPFLHFTREGPFGVCTLDRPEARNAMTPAMYFGIRYAISHVDADPDLAGLLITGTGDVFAPGGDLVGQNKLQRAVPDVVAITGDPDASVRRAVVATLQALDDVRSLPGLVALTSDPQKDIRESAVTGVTRLYLPRESGMGPSLTRVVNFFNPNSDEWADVVIEPEYRRRPDGGAGVTGAPPGPERQHPHQGGAVHRHPAGPRSPCRCWSW